MPALTLAASMLVAFWNAVPLASALCPLPSQCFLLAQPNLGKRHEGPRADFGSITRTKVDARDRLSLATRALGRERDGDLHGAVADYAILNKEAGDNAWAQERLEWCQGLLEMSNKNLDRLLMAVRIAPAKFARTYYSAVMDCDARTRRLLLHLLDTRMREHPSDDAALCLRALIRHVDGQVQNAIQDYKFYLWNHPCDSELYLFLACAQKQTGDKYGALDSARQFAQHNAKNDYGMALYCLLLVETGSNREAEAIASRALESSSPPGWAYFIRGVENAKKGTYSVALENLSCVMQEEVWWPNAAKMRCLVHAASGDLNAALADAEEILVRYPCKEAIRLRACIYSMRCEFTAAVSDWLQWLNEERDALADNKNAPVGKAINPFDISWNFDAVRITSEQEVALCGSYFVVAALLKGNRAQAASFVDNPKRYKGDWRPCLARGFYHVTGGDYALALRELRMALEQPEYRVPEEVLPSMASPPKFPEENKVAVRDGLSIASFDELVNTEREDNRQVSPVPVNGMKPLVKPIKSGSK